MAADLRKRKKRTRWGADLENDLGDPVTEAVEASTIQRATDALESADGVAENEFKRSRKDGDALGEPQQEQGWGRTSKWQSEDPPGHLQATQDVASGSGWAGVASLSKTVPPPMQPSPGFSLSFARPAPKIKAAPPPAPVALPTLNPHGTDLGRTADHVIPAALPGKAATSPEPRLEASAVAPAVAAASTPATDEEADTVPGEEAEAVGDATPPPSQAEPFGGKAATNEEAPDTGQRDTGAPAPDNMIVAMPAEGTTPEQGDAAELPTPDLDSAGLPASIMPDTAAEADGKAEIELQPSVGAAPAQNPAPESAAKEMAAEKAPKSTAKPLPKDPCSLVVSSIRPTANEQSLRLLFESAGQVLGCKLVKDEATGQHRGFGFVMMASRVEAEAAARKFHNFEWGDVRMQVTVKLPDKEKPAQPADPSLATATQPSWTVASTESGSLGQSAETSLPLPPPLVSSQSGLPHLSEAATQYPLGAPEVNGTPGAPGMPSSLPIASAYGGYPPYDPYSAYYGYGYGYGDPYAAYAGQPYGLPNGVHSALTPAEDERPPGMEDDELPPGLDEAPAVIAPAYLDHQEPGPPGEIEHDPADVKREEEVVVAPPPPPAPPKKEPTVIHVPLKIPEGARKKQEERKKAREEKAKQLAEDEAAAVDAPANGDATNDADSVVQHPKPTPAVIGTKGSFQEVLARRQAELAALKAKKSGTDISRGGVVNLRGTKRGRSFSRSPPPRYRRSRSPSRGFVTRSPFRGGRRSNARASRSPSRSYSRSPASSLSRSYSRSRSPGGLPRRASGIRRSPSRYSYSGSDGPHHNSASPSVLRRKDKVKSKEKKEKKRKIKKEKKRKSKTADVPELALQQSLKAEQPIIRSEFMLPPKVLDEKPAPGWVEVDPNEPRREIKLPSPPQEKEPTPPNEPPVFRRPARKRTRTRWHVDEERAHQEQERGGRERHRESEARLGARSADHHHQEQAKDSERDAGEIVAEKRKPSPQVSEEGEIALEDGEIEGELLEEPESVSVPAPSPRERNRTRNMAYDDYNHDDRYRVGYNQSRYMNNRGRGRGNRGGWAGYGPDSNRYDNRGW